MSSNDLKELDKKLAELWKAGRAAEAVELLEQSIAKYPEKFVSMNLDLAIFYLGLNNTDKCLEVLHRSLEKGIWYPKVYFSKLEGDERFDKLFEEWDKMAAQAAENAKPYWRLFTPDGYDSAKKYPLFIAMHGWGEDVDMFAEHWRSDLIKKQYVLVLAQSSQRIGTINYCWDDRDKGHQDLQEIYKQVVDRYSIDAENIIVGGFSQGATMAIDTALNFDYMKVRGFIALNPDKPDEFEQDKLKMARDKGMRGCIITGDQDQSFEQQKEMTKEFELLGLKCRMDVIAGWGHWFPEDLSQRLDDAIAYIDSIH